MRNLAAMSVNELRKLAEEALSVAAELENEKPSDRLAIMNGVENRTYNTVRNGWVAKFSGKSYVRQADGNVWLCTGYGPEGNAYSEIASGSYTKDDSLIADALAVMYATAR